MKLRAFETRLSAVMSLIVVLAVTAVVGSVVVRISRSGFGEHLVTGPGVGRIEPARRH